MDDEYYIPEWEFLRDKLEEGDKNALAIQNKGNVIRIRNEEDRSNFIESIKKIEFINDKELYDYFKENFYGAIKYLEIKPIQVPALKEALSFLFEELPDDLFEQDDVITALKKLFNHFIKKNEITFIVMNMSNKNLNYDGDYKYKTLQEFYFLMLKLDYNLDTYYEFFCRTQSALSRLFSKEILFSDEKIDRKRQDLLNRIFNLTANNLEDYKMKLEIVKNQIKGHRRTIKIANIITLDKYNIQEKQVLEKIDSTIKDINERVNECYTSKKRLEEEVKKRHGLISIETAKNILKEIKWFRPFVK